MIRHRVPNIPVTNNNSPAGNAKRFPLTRNKEDQPNAWILPQVLESIDAAVSAPGRNCKSRIVKTPHESRAIPPCDRSTMPDGSVEPTAMNGDAAMKSRHWRSSLVRILLVNHLLAGPTIFRRSVSVVMTPSNR
jgi:hypothetical protein